LIAFPRCLWLISRQTFRDLLVSKKTILFVLGSLFYAALITIVIRSVGDREDHNELFAFISLGFLWQGLVPLTAMYFSIATARDEIANRTLVFLISGPVPRASIWLGKFLASSAVVILVLGIGCLAAAAGATLAGGDSLRRVANSTMESPFVPLLFAVPAYCAVGTLFALFFRRPMITGAVFIIGWEQFVGASPGQAGVRSLTVVDSARTLLYHRLPAAVEYLRAQRNWRGGGHQVELPPASEAIHTLLWLTAIALALALWVGGRRNYGTPHE